MIDVGVVHHRGARYPPAILNRWFRCGEDLPANERHIKRYFGLRGNPSTKRRQLPRTELLDRVGSWMHRQAGPLMWADVTGFTLILQQRAALTTRLVIRSRHPVRLG